MTVLALNNGLWALKCGLHRMQTHMVKPLLAGWPKSQAIRRHKVQGGPVAQGDAMSEGPLPAQQAPGDPSLMDAAALALALGTDLERGLDPKEAARRLAVDGPNALRAAPAVPAWRRALAQLQDPLVYLLGGAAAVALAAWWFEGRGQGGVAGWPLDAMVIAVVVVLNAVLGWLQEAKAAQAVAALAKMTMATSAVLRGGAAARVPSAELVKGDLLVLAEATQWAQMRA